MVKTLLFCTSYTNSIDDWKIKYSIWLNHHRNINILFNKSLIVDDGSQVLPNQNEIIDTSILYHGKEYFDEPETHNIIYHYHERLGRHGIFNYPGWYRSFGYAIQYAVKFNYEKIIHIESDAYIISNNLVNYINSINNDWITLWVPRYGIAETAIQIIAGENYIQDCYNIFQKPYSEFVNRSADTDIETNSWLNYKINRDFYGDRWGEVIWEVPQTADYACQIIIQEYLSKNLAWFIK